MLCSLFMLIDKMYVIICNLLNTVAHGGRNNIKLKKKKKKESVLISLISDTWLIESLRY